MNQQIQTRKPVLSISNLPMNCGDAGLKQELLKFGTVISIGFDHDSYGWINGGNVVFERIEDAQQLMNSIAKHPIIFEGRKLNFQWDKEQ